MPFKVFCSDRNKLQKAIEEWLEGVGPIRSVSMAQSYDDKNFSVVLTVFYEEGSGTLGAGYGGPRSLPPNGAGDREEPEKDYGPAPQCPKCESDMVLRRRKADNVPFWGCTDFPSCRGIVNVDDDAQPKKNGKKKSDEPLPGQGSLGFSGGDGEDDIPF